MGQLLYYLGFLKGMCSVFQEVLIPGECHSYDILHGLLKDQI